jgi:hypothetical protein
LIGRDEHDAAIASPKNLLDQDKRGNQRMEATL